MATSLSIYWIKHYPNAVQNLAILHQSQYSSQLLLQVCSSAKFSYPPKLSGLHFTDKYQNSNGTMYSKMCFRVQFSSSKPCRIQKIHPAMSVLIHPPAPLSQFYTHIIDSRALHAYDTVQLYWVRRWSWMLSVFMNTM